ncbi:helix-turn-helix domain-containing protein [Pseudomonas sp. MPB26]|uniref:helix-turn-helix domain-containing protein n=1 Tax=Pseudomonas sp. MPB26 TaxID=3388491 RepID=UPI003984D762
MVDASPHIQVINDAAGKPVFVVIPYRQYLSQQSKGHLIPGGVVDLIIEGLTPIRAWREYLNLTQQAAAERLGISQSAFAQQESVKKPRRATRARIAKAFGIDVRQLEL